MSMLRHILAVVFVALFAASPRGQAAPSAQPTVATKPATAIERPLLWRIELPMPSYLFGTIHLPDDRVTDLPPVVTEAIGSCGALFTEIPMDMDKLMAAAQAAMLPKGTKLVDQVGEELYARMKAYVEGRGQKMTVLDRMKPWAGTTQLMVIDMMAQMATKQPLDMKLYAGAKKAGKKVGGLETVESQLAVFEVLSLEEQRNMLKATLGELEKQVAEGKSPVEELIQLYLRGDEAALDKRMNEYPLGDEALSAKIKDRLLANRNGDMVDRMVEELQCHPDRGAFFAVGAAHYGGELGIVKLLRDRGYRITRLELSPTPEVSGNEAEAIDGEIARREKEIELLRARRGKLVGTR